MHKVFKKFANGANGTKVIFDLTFCAKNNTLMDIDRGKAYVFKQWLL